MIPVSPINVSELLAGPPIRVLESYLGPHLAKAGSQNRLTLRPPPQRGDRGYAPDPVGKNKKSKIRFLRFLCFPFLVRLPRHSKAIHNF
jgi:hypothetical protein